MNNIHCRVKIQNKLSEPINVKNRVWQGNALACLLFSIALEKIIRDAAVSIRGTIFHKSVQILAYADDIHVIGRTQSAIIEAFTSLEKAAKSMNLHINPYPTALPYGNGMVLHFYQQQESSTTKTLHKVINKGLKAYV